MKTKTKIKITPLSISIIQGILLILLIFFITITRERFFLGIIISFLFIMYLLLTMTNGGYEELSGLCKYRICKEKILNSDSYYIQVKPLLLPFLPWKFGAYDSYFYKKDWGEYMFCNSFKTKEEAEGTVQMLKSRDELKKLFLIKKIEVL